MAQVTLRVPATGHSQIYTNSSNVSLAQNATFTLTAISNIGAIVGILAQKDHNGTLNYPSALYYVAYNKATQIIKYAGASWDIEDGGSDFVLYDGGSANVIFKNRCSTTTLFCFHVWSMGGV